MARFRGPERLDSDHQISGFDCGDASLDVWLARHARAASGAGSAKTYVVTDREQHGRVVAYSALTGASIQTPEATQRAATGMGRYEIPAVLLSRLAVDQSVRDKRIGALLLQDAMSRAVAVSEQVGIRLLLAHAASASARRFYLKFGFEESPSDPMNLQLLIKDIKATLAA